MALRTAVFVGLVGQCSASERSSSEANPIRRVVTLIQGLQKKVENEAAREGSPAPRSSVRLLDFARRAEPRSAGIRWPRGHLRSEKKSDIGLQSRHNAGKLILAKFARSNPRNHGTETGRVFYRKTAVSASILPKQIWGPLSLSCAMRAVPFPQGDGPPTRESVCTNKTLQLYASLGLGGGKKNVTVLPIWVHIIKRTSNLGAHQKWYHETVTITWYHSPAQHTTILQKRIGLPLSAVRWVLLSFYRETDHPPGSPSGRCLATGQIRHPPTLRFARFGRGKKKRYGFTVSFGQKPTTRQGLPFALHETMQPCASYENLKKHKKHQMCCQFT